MKSDTIQGVILTPLKIIQGEKGAVLHAMKRSDASFCGFGEAYFSTVDKGQVKGWRRHTEMTLNVVVPCGEIKFVLHDDRIESTTCGRICEVILSRKNYQRLTVPPMVWMGFMGMGDVTNVLLNIGSIPHDPQESDYCELADAGIQHDW